MKNAHRGMLAFALLVLPPTAHAQTPYWHIDPNVKTCSMAIDPTLTQAQWRTFTGQVGAIASFKALSPAEPLGRGHVSFGIDLSSTAVDQHDPAWINTFVHPDANCPLGDNIQLPMVRARVGVTDRMDLGALWSKAPGANYGLAGGEVRYLALRETRRVPALAIVGSATALTGVPDFDLSIGNVGVLASKRFRRITPFAGLRDGLAMGTETTSQVNLKREIVPYSQGFVGAVATIWHLGLAAEYDVAEVNTFALVLEGHL